MGKESLKLSAEQLGKVIRLFAPSMDDYLYVCDFKEDDYQISPGAVERFLLPSDHFSDVAGKHREFTYPEDVPLIMEEISLLSQGKKLFHDLHYRWLDHDRNPIWINCRGRVLLDEDGTPHFLVGCINEIGKKQKADNVSGLLGASSLEICFRTFGGKIPPGFVLRLGIDDFKDINENQGIEYGDYILRRTALCIEKELLPGQQIFRIVADEFAVVDFAGGGREEALQLYQRIRMSVFSFIEENRYEAVYTVSGGVLLNDEVDGTFENAMKLSEFALSEAKRGGRNNCCVFDKKHYEGYLRRRELHRALHHAVNHGFEGFEVHFQPLVNAEDGRLSGAESLLRFQMPDGGMISPAEFVPILEESGLIIPVGRWILRQALYACREWQKYLPGFKVNVNLSYIQVLKSDVLHEIIEIVEEFRMRPSSVCVELTESGYLDESPHFTKVWNGLKAYGILLALDDFGTGYSNLHCLSDLKPAYVKIDRTFMEKALNRDYEYRLLFHIIEMAHSLGLNVCAEGIENEEELARARTTDPDLIQGFLFGRPCARTEFTEKFFSSSH